MRKTSPIKIRVTCTGSRTLPIDELHDFQGELKSLSEEAYAKLRNEIVLKGISFPVAVWWDGHQNQIIDGHQRLRVMRRMADSGIEIPEIPVVDIEAASEKEAKEKVLAAASQYGTVEGEGLYQFMHDAGLEFAEVNAAFQFPEIDLPVFHAEYFKTPEVADPRGEAVPAVAPPAQVVVAETGAPEPEEEAAEEEPAAAEAAPEGPEVTKLDPVEPEAPKAPGTPQQRPIDVDDKESVTYKLLPEEKQDLMYRLDDLMKAYKVNSHAEVVTALVADAHRKLKKPKK